MSDVGIIAKFLTEVAKVVGNWQVSKEKNRLMYRIESAMEYVFVSERAGEYKDISDKKQQSLLLHFRKRIFDAS